MPRLRRWLVRLSNAFRPGREEPDLSREVAAHVALLEDEFVRRGMTSGEARRAAVLSLGGIEQTKELHRDARSFIWLDDARRDLQHAVRLLRRNPIFALTAALSLAIGIGANTTIFTVANRLLFREPVGVADPGRLVDIAPTENGRFSEPVVPYPTYLDIRQRVTTLEGVHGYALDLQPMSLAGPDGAERIFGSLVTSNYFAVLGVRPAAGRLFNAGDSEEPGASPIVVLSHSFWTRRFNANPAVVGQTLQLTGHPFVVVGVAREGFQGTSVLMPDVWVPAAMTAAVSELTTSVLRVAVGGRLKPGVPLLRAASEVELIGQALERERPKPRMRMTPDGVRQENLGGGLRLVAWSPIPPIVRLPATAFIAVLMLVVSLVLVIACANVAGVLLARATARRRAIAVRVAIGAGRARLIRQLITETMLLFVLGGAAGLLLARGMTSLLISVLPSLPLPVDVSLPLDGRVVLWTTGLSLVAAILSGLAPALQASKADVVSALKDDPQGPADRLRLRNAFVIAQVAFSVLLVVSAGLLVRALRNASAVDLGFDPRGVEVTSLDLSLAGYTRTTGPLFVRELANRVRELPSVQAATMAQLVPMGGGMRLCCGVTVPGATPPNGQRFFEPNWNVVEPGYFATLRMPVVAGRDFNDADRNGTQPVAIVGAAAARQFWPNTSTRDVVGQFMLWQTGVPGALDRASVVVKLLVVGVAGDVKSGGPEGLPRRIVYVPMQQRYDSRMMVLARTTHGQRITGEIRALVASMNPNLPIVGARTLEDQSSPVLLQLRVSASVSGAIGLVGMLLAAIGIYGVTAYAVTRRTHEIGVRIALGARRTDVIAMVLRQGMSLVTLGAAIGLCLGAGAGRLLSTWLVGIPAIDPITFGGSALLFAFIGLVACYVPAYRATSVNPTDALRHE
jgi:predicted permease